jgi:hypothetical protein
VIITLGFFKMDSYQGTVKLLAKAMAIDTMVSGKKTNVKVLDNRSIQMDLYIMVTVTMI